MNSQAAAHGFQQAFHARPAVISRAPGRVNLIGEHTDYNDGFVMPAAIEFALWCAAAPRPDRRLRAVAGDRADSVEIDLDQPGDPRQRHWSDYVRGIAVELERDGHRLRGADLWFSGNVPEGAGLSSSAALETGVGLTLLAVSGIAADPVRLALAGQRAEHHYVGTRCGIMDQFISANARAGHAMMLDCRTLEARWFPLPDRVALVICDTGVKHELAAGEYNTRRSQCESGVAALRERLPGITALRDVSSADLETHGGRLPEVIRRRCRHVVTENERVLAFAEALRNHDLHALGPLMAQSHASLRDDYEVSCRELDVLVELAADLPGVLGARMTGGGFGGCTINLVAEDQSAAFEAAITEAYRERTGRAPRVFITRAAGGASLEPVP